MSRGGRLVPALVALLLAWSASVRSEPSPVSGPAAPGARPPTPVQWPLLEAAPGPSTPGSRAAPLAGVATPLTTGFATLEPGLELGTYAGPPGSPGDGSIWVVRVDPARFELRLLNASASDSRPRTLREWVASAGASVAINAGMFQTDGLTGIGLMRTRLHQNNARLSRRLKSVLAFDPQAPGLPPVALLDADCGEVEPLPPYGAFVQSIRMVSCDRKNVWSPEGRHASAAAIGVDGVGRALFIHVRSPFTVHELADALLALPIDLRRAMYVEGGPEAQLLVRGGGRELERRGAFDGLAGDDRSGLAWELPNVVVAVRRAR